MLNLQKQLDIQQKINSSLIIENELIQKMYNDLIIQNNNYHNNPHNCYNNNYYNNINSKNSIDYDDDNDDEIILLNPQNRIMNPQNRIMKYPPGFEKNDLK